MRRFSPYRPSPAMIVACVALVVSLGGTSYAAITLPAGSVGTKQLKNDAVVGSKVKNGSLTLSDIKTSSLSRLGRVAHDWSSGTLTESNQAVASVSLTVPKTGFVMVQGWVTASDATGQWGVRVSDDTAVPWASSRWINYVSGTGTWSTSGNTAVFPVTAGVRTFSVRVPLTSAATGFTYYSSITAQFIPYSGTGGATPPPASPDKGPEQTGAQD